MAVELFLFLILDLNARHVAISVFFYIDFCISCKLTKEHPHKNFWVWAPYLITVKPIPPVKISYYPNEELIREWMIFNEGDEPLTRFYITCVAGECCSKT